MRNSHWDLVEGTSEEAFIGIAGTIKVTSKRESKIFFNTCFMIITPCLVKYITSMFKIAIFKRKSAINGEYAWKMVSGMIGCIGLFN